MGGMEETKYCLSFTNYVGYIFVAIFIKIEKVMAVRRNKITNNIKIG
jgi:hypothetical protein